MILSEILGLPVLDPQGKKVGTIIDVRFVVDGRPRQLLADARLYGFIVGRHARHSFMGYERSGTNSPAGIARFLRWRERGAFLVLWSDVKSVTATMVVLESDYQPYSPGIRS
jgi:sporulation protein YlmC with PRC-barrel domain